jgi:nucleotide-binding universal stress UspA family protein
MPATKLQKRVTINNILFATDFSRSAKTAMPYAMGLARSFDANLYAMHVQEPINYALPPVAWQAIRDTDEIEMKSMSEELRGHHPELRAHVLKGEGQVWNCIETAIKQHQIDLIVVGTSGRRGVVKALLGSQAEEILRHAPCPVLTVGPHVSSPQRSQGKISSILFATNFGPASLAASQFAVSLAEEYQSKLTLLHVCDNRPSDAVESPSGFSEASERQLRSLVPDEAELWCQPHFAVIAGEPAAAILTTADRTKADLIVLGSHKPTGVPGAATHLSISTVHKIISQADCAVLTIPA